MNPQGNHLHPQTHPVVHPEAPILQWKLILRGALNNISLFQYLLGILSLLPQPIISIVSIHSPRNTFIMSKTAKHQIVRESIVNQAQMMRRL